MELLHTQRGQECVVGVFDDFDHARDAVLALNQAGFLPERISLVAPGAHEHPEVRESLQYGDETTRNAAKGAGLGGLAGLLVGGAALTASGLGPIFAAGYIATALTGAIAGAFLGAMSGWGVHEDHIAEYEEMVRQGKTLVMFHGDPLQTAEAERILQRCRAGDVRLHAAAADEGPEVDDRPYKPR
jgi:outer membrane lipoprotein SlyB